MLLTIDSNNWHSVTQFFVFRRYWKYKWHRKSHWKKLEKLRWKNSKWTHRKQKTGFFNGEYKCTWPYRHIVVPPRAPMNEGGIKYSMLRKLGTARPQNKPKIRFLTFGGLYFMEGLLKFRECKKFSKRSTINVISTIFLYSENISPSAFFCFKLCKKVNTF